MKTIFNSGKKNLNRDMLGYTIEKKNIIAGKDEISAFAKATRDNNPLYESAAAVAPPLYASRLAFPMMKEIFVHKDLNVNILRMVHGEQELIWRKPIRQGDALDVKTEIKEIADTSAGETMNISTVAYHSGEAMLEAIATVLIRGKGKTKKDKQKSGEEKPPKEIFKREIETFDGQQLEYAQASGDTNFIHTNNFLAKLAGLPRTIMHGMCIMAMTTAAIRRVRRI